MRILDWDEIKFLEHKRCITKLQFSEYSEYDQKKFIRIFEVIGRSRDGYISYIKRRKREKDDSRTNNST